MTVNSVSKVAAHEIAGHRWYTASVRRLITGIAESDHHVGIAPILFVNCAWETRVLLSPTAPNRGLTVIGSGAMGPPTDEDIPNLPAQQQFDPGVTELASFDLTGRRTLDRLVAMDRGSEFVHDFLAEFGDVPLSELRDGGLPYTGALARNLAIERRLRNMHRQADLGLDDDD
ncbi:hypothetical protein ABT169_15945 [Streptomyces sp. NPDC001616]|uniref:hypothetical protein n=1 Tax=Streptomyces sp. NPDC001616 TaxID=3156648 RepID=UPI00332AF37B